MDNNSLNVNKASKPPKSPTGIKVVTPRDKPCLTLVRPVLQEVGKLAAGVASVSTGSATGNPRNKCALQPGHSLMDWIRLGASGKDLTGVGSNAGKLLVNPRELAAHGQKDDAWISIRGKVYNITDYLPFHPGGIPELIRGAGQDATQLFNEVHPWVNYESILQKCFIGRLTSLESGQDPESLFQGTSTQKSPPNQSDLRKTVLTKTLNSLSPIKTPSSLEFVVPSQPQTQISPPPQKPQIEMPRFDWIQKCDSITIIFYTKAFCNAQIHILKPNAKNEVIAEIKYDHVIYSNTVKLSESVVWPCDVVSNLETGKIEVVFRKIRGEIWKNYGVLQQKFCNDRDLSEGFRMKFRVAKNVALTHNTHAVLVESLDEGILFVPMAHHMRIFKTDDMSKSYTPIPINFLYKTIDNPLSKLLLVIKMYPDGNVSKHVCSVKERDLIELSTPIDPLFKLQDLERREVFLMIAAGVGVTPMIGLINFLLCRRLRKCQKLSLLFFNRTEKDLLFNQQFTQLQNSDKRFKFVNVLSQPLSPNTWKGPRGHVSTEMLRNETDLLSAETGASRNDFYYMACGPDGFINLVDNILRTDLEIRKEQVFSFLG